MAQPDINHYRAAEVGARLGRGEWGLPSAFPGSQPGEPPAETRRRLDQQRLLDVIRSVGLAAVRPAPPPAVTPAGRMDRVSAVLASWRAAERELSERPADSPDRPRLQALVEGLRVAHHRLFAERRDDSSQP